MVHNHKYPLCSFDPDLVVKVIQNFAQYLLHYVTYASAKFEIVMSSRIRIYKKKHLTFHLGVKDIQNFAQYPPHHVTYVPTKFIVAMSNGLGGDAFTRKYII